MSKYTRRIAAQIPAIRRLAEKGTKAQRKIAKKWLALCTPDELALADRLERGEA